MKYSFDIWTYDIAIVSEHKYTRIQVDGVEKPKLCRAVANSNLITVYSDPYGDQMSHFMHFLTGNRSWTVIRDTHSGPHNRWISIVVSPNYQFNVISFSVEYNYVIKCFTRWVDEFTMPIADENLINFTRFMTDFNRYFRLVNFLRWLNSPFIP